jgi:hypothetical protein
VSNQVRTGDLRNHNPQAGGYKCLSSPEVTTPDVTVGPSVGPETTGHDAKSDDFAAALAMISTLPLSDAVKAEAVQRLLQSQRHQDRHNRSN